MNPVFKEKLKAHCLAILIKKAKLLSSELLSLRETAATESKSSAGDKHETTKAMIHLEQEKTGKQLAETEEQIAALEKLQIIFSSGKIIKGSLVQTDKGLFFIATAIGKVKFEEKEIVVLSEFSPLGKLLLNGESGKSISFNGNNYLIVSVN